MSASSPRRRRPSFAACCLALATTCRAPGPMLRRPSTRTAYVRIQKILASGRHAVVADIDADEYEWQFFTCLHACSSHAMSASSPRRRRPSFAACCLALATTSLHRNGISRASAFSPKLFREHSSRVRRRSHIATASALFASSTSDNSDDGGPSPPLAAISSVSKRLKGSCSGACRSYMNWLSSKPLTANCITGGLIAFLGDILAQLIECRVGRATSTACSIGGNRLNFLRMMSFSASGIVFVGPYLHYFYCFLWSLGSHLQKRYNTSRRQQVILQVLLDQTIGIILFYPVYYYVYEYCEAIFGLQTLGPVVERATSKMMQGGNLMSVLKMNWAVWIPAQICTFWFVPERLRVIVSNIVSVFWNCYLCTKVA